MYYDYSGPTEPRQPGEPPRTYIDSGVCIEPPSTRTTSYIYDEDGVIMRTERDNEGRPVYPCVPRGYGAPVWSEMDSQWYAVRLGVRSDKPHNTVYMYSPNGNRLLIEKEVRDQVVRQQRGRCAVTGRKFRRQSDAHVMRLDVREAAELDNLVAVESWMLKDTEPVTYELLVQQWNARVDARKSGNVTSATRRLPF